MKKYLRFSLYVALVVTMAGGVSSCSDDDDPGNDESDAKDLLFAEIAEQFVHNTVNATYQSLADSTEILVDKLKALQEDKTDARVEAVCQVFLQARAQWEKCEAFLFGAATDFGIDPHIDSWPLDLDGLRTALKNTAQIEAMAGENGDVYAGEKLGNSLLGFHGIEYIIFKDGNAKPVAEISNTELIYAIAVAGDLRNRCFQLELAWAGEGNVKPGRFEKVNDDLELPVTVNGGAYSYGQNMLNAGKPGSTYSSRISAMEAIIDGCKTIADEVGTSKIGKPHNGEDENYIESPYSRKSIPDFYDNIISIQNAYMGGIEGKRNEAHSLHAYVKGVDEALDTRVTAAMATALTRIKAMKAPFVIYYKDASAGEAITACKNLDAVLSEVKTTLRK